MPDKPTTPAKGPLYSLHRHLVPGVVAPGRLNHAHAAPSRDEIRRAQMDEDSGQSADDREGRDVS